MPIAPTPPLALTVLVVSNDENVNLINTQSSTGAITVGENARIFSEGVIDFATSGTVSIDPSARYGTRNLGLDVGTINISSTDPDSERGRSSGSSTHSGHSRSNPCWGYGRRGAGIAEIDAHGIAIDQFLRLR